jgi:hypothetical protein
MDLSQLKTQVMTMFMMNPKKDGSQTDTVYTMVYTMIMMNLMEYVFKHLPVVAAWLQVQATAYLDSKRKQLNVSLTLPTKQDAKEELSSIQLSRTYGDKVPANTNTEKVDAVLEYICNLDNAKHVRIDTRCSINNAEEIQVTPLIMAKVSEPKAASSTDESGSIQILLYSKYLRISELRTWVDEVHANYMTEKANKLGNRIYYFNEMPIEPMQNTDPVTKKPVYRLETAPKQLVFTMNEFRTGKSFNNVYGDHVVDLKERLDLFVNHPEWYLERGIPHSIGIMLHGVPGAGKTSTIKAIANDTKRHIFNLSLRAFTTQRQLTNLFYNETVSVLDPALGTQQTFKIPLNRRVYVIEDIDCLTDVVLDRAFKEQSAPKKKVKKTIKDGKEIIEEEEEEHAKPAGSGGNDSITLSFLLNLLDGVLETPGRILVITSNYPERLDRALIRPGRIDVRIEFTNASRTFIRDTINKFYTVSIPLEKIPDSIDARLTPAEVMESLCANFKNYNAAIDHMVARVARNSRKPSLEPVKVKPIQQVAEESNILTMIDKYDITAHQFALEKKMFTALDDLKDAGTEAKVYEVDKQDKVVLKDHDGSIIDTEGLSTEEILAKMRSIAQERSANLVAPFHTAHTTNIFDLPPGGLSAASGDDGDLASF